MKKALIALILSVLVSTPMAAAQAGCNITINCGCDCTVNVCSCDNGCGNNYKPRTYSIEDVNLYNKLKGRIILRVEGNGEAFYVSPSERTVYYLGNSVNALQTLQWLGVGASNSTLRKAKLGIINMYGNDSDRDGLADNYEYSIGTDRNNFNTDRDVYSDYAEITTGYNPVGPGKLPIDYAFTRKYSGRVLIQVQSLGEAWYINPTDQKRYLLSNEYEMHDVIKKFGIGISNYNFSRLVK
jgi:hypothetical protein